MVMLMSIIAIVLLRVIYIVKYEQQNCLDIYNGSSGAQHCKYPYSSAAHILYIT